MKVTIIGFEISEGISKKTNAPYSIGKLYAALPLAGGKGVKGYMGTEYRCEVSVLRKIEHLNCPFEGDIEQVDVMRFGERKQEIVSIVPVSRAPASTSSAVRAAA
jgi:CTX phage RstB protein